ncbi:MAG: divalent-cation tolerance protein CutA [Deltaproteobacteria bacterium]|nr:divalent-cation tolerance protein CutA [Deltaproteobacteria bacterium]
MAEAMVYITAPNTEEAERIAEKLVADRLCACVNIIPEIRSVYWWDGAVQKGSEVALISKTREILVPAVIEAVKAMHSYEVPAIVSWPISRGNPDFLNWIRDVTRIPPV